MTVRHARSEILEVREAGERSDAGVFRGRFTGWTDEGVTVVEGERTILVETRAAWGARDAPARLRREESP